MFKYLSLSLNSKESGAAVDSFGFVPNKSSTRDFVLLLVGLYSFFEGFVIAGLSGAVDLLLFIVDEGFGLDLLPISESKSARGSSSNVKPLY